MEKIYKLLFLFLIMGMSSLEAQISLPYSENFGTITVANGFPTVSGGAWTRTGSTTVQPTYITNQASYNIHFPEIEHPYLYLLVDLSSS